ncbi:6-phosphogluconolactonase [Cryobacterium sp. TMT1-21]|uniref:6-phosphogluconolactonase n=1 Tax=Cryobacterium shii TaxID=1259235 RepID=A0AAQ2C727_9MICO|nr:MULTISPECIES: 6-phosphogluconolactonase [Cryobacterium]TFC49102.1 6-phosphogluconolactonase [Cryobacterium shii]TFC83592.1 6-phosphogluconolactonase [Cryobacterium sp. TmT2-59]TFD16074.1 6-phosphogluconolactonase [Cryobacterium sp. TMT1-21]TFD22023.1 6-phosphogluconolactonase [Cryobacterium sp. TMT4-10]TFD28215.1 6-phosphogluconolactonase [Cryobacterium sp. TMT2-23]
MTNERRVLVHPNRAALAASVAARFITTAVDLLHEQGDLNVVLTGGSVAVEVLEAVNASAARDTIDWEQVAFWWGDERWVPKNHPERNELQARTALLDHIEIPAGNIHPFAASDEGLDLDEAAASYAAELESHSIEGTALPRFDVTFLGVGPDGHVASLFPHQAGIRENAASVIAVRSSPKPPAERLSLTRPALNSSRCIWMVLAGPDKASALGLALAGASRDEVPVAGIKGRRYTNFFVDREAAAEVPENLTASSF